MKGLKFQLHYMLLLVDSQPTYTATVVIHYYIKAEHWLSCYGVLPELGSILGQGKNECLSLLLFMTLSGSSMHEIQP